MPHPDSFLKNTQVGMERWLSSQEHWPFFQRSGVQFPAATRWLTTICLLLEFRGGPAPSSGFLSARQAHDAQADRFKFSFARQLALLHLPLGFFSPVTFLAFLSDWTAQFASHHSVWLTC